MNAFRKRRSSFRRTGGANTVVFDRLEIMMCILSLATLNTPCRSMRSGWAMRENADRELEPESCCWHGLFYN